MRGNIIDNSKRIHTSILYCSKEDRSVGWIVLNTTCGSARQCCLEESEGESSGDGVVSYSRVCGEQNPVLERVRDNTYLANKACAEREGSDLVRSSSLFTDSY